MSLVQEEKFVANLVVKTVSSDELYVLNETCLVVSPGMVVMSSMFIITDLWCVCYRAILNCSSYRVCHRNGAF